MRAIGESFDEYAKLNEKIGKDLVSTIAGIEDPCRLGRHDCGPRGHEGQRTSRRFFRSRGSIQGLKSSLTKLRDEINILRLENRLKKRVKKQMEKTQKDYYLNEQMRAIQKEMGTKDDFKAELADLEKKIKRKTAVQGGPRQGLAGVQEAQDDVAHVCGSDGGAQLHRLDHCSSLGRENQGEAGHQGSGTDPGRRSLRSEETEGENPGVSGGAGPHEEDQADRSSAWWVLRAWERPPSPSRLPGPRAAISCGFLWAA